MHVPTGDAVVYGAATATVVIEANDDANGIFSLEPVEKPVEEGKTNHFKWGDQQFISSNYYQKVYIFEYLPMFCC